MQILTSCEELSLTHKGHIFKAKDSVNLKGCVAFYWLAVLQLKGCRVKKNNNIQKAERDHGCDHRIIFCSTLQIGNFPQGYCSACHLNRKFK